MKLFKRLAYAYVAKDLMTNNEHSPLFNGIYDATKGSADFMYGVSAVMEQIGEGIGKKTSDQISNLLIENITKSQIRAGIYRP